MRYYCVTQLLLHAFTPLLRYSVTPLLRYSVTPLLRYSVTPLLRYSVTPLLRYSVTPLLRYSVTPLLRYSVTPLLRYSITTLLTVTFLSNDIMDRYFLFTGNGPSNGSYFFDQLFCYFLLHYSVTPLFCYSSNLDSVPLHLYRRTPLGA